MSVDTDVPTFTVGKTGDIASVASEKWEMGAWGRSEGVLGAIIAKKHFGDYMPLRLA